MPIIGNMTTESLLIAGSGIVIVFLMLAVLSVIIMVISRVVGMFAGAAAKPAPAGAPAASIPSASPMAVPPRPAAAPAAPFAQSAPGAGTVALSGVDDLTAACIMAIVSDETGVPLEQLNFKSIKAM